MSDDALMLVRRRVIFITMFAWLPLLVLSGLDDHLLGSSSTTPFVFDVEVHVRLLVAMPMLILAERVVHRRMSLIVQQFLKRNLIPDTALMRFGAAIESAARLRNSRLAEFLLIAFVYAFDVVIIWGQYIALDPAKWYAMPSSSGRTLTIAGLWYGYVSLPIF